MNIRSSRILALGIGAAVGVTLLAGAALAVGSIRPLDAAVHPTLPALSVADIVARNVAARGGLAAWQGVHAIEYSGQLDAGVARPDNGLNPASRERLLEKPSSASARKPGERQEPKPVEGLGGTPIELPYKLIVSRPNKQRLEIRFKDETLVQVFDGVHGWKLQPYLRRGGALPFNKEEMRQARQFQDIDGPLVDYRAKGTQVALDGTDLVDGRPAYRLKLTLKSGDVRHLWIDAQSFLDAQIDGVRKFNGHEVPIYTRMRDYRRVDGVEVPYLMDTRTAGLDNHEKIVVDRVDVNPPVSADLFAKPR